MIRKDDDLLKLYLLHSRCVECVSVWSKFVMFMFSLIILKKINIPSLQTFFVQN